MEGHELLNSAHTVSEERPEYEEPEHFLFPIIAALQVNEDVIVVTTSLNDLVFASMLDKGVGKLLGEKYPEKKGRVQAILSFFSCRRVNFS